MENKLNSESYNLNLTISSGLVIALYCFLIANMRPAIVGQKFGTLYSIFILCVLLTYFFIKGNSKIRLFNETKIFAVLCLMMFFYTCLQLLLISPNTIIDAVKVFIFIFLGIAPIFILKKSDIEYFSKILIYINTGIGTSYLISYGLLIVLGVKLTIGTISLPMTGDYVYEFDILVPFSPIYNGMANIGGTLFPRAIGYLREPGLYQMIIIISYWLQDLYKFKGDVFIKTVLLSSLLFTFSTAGFVIFFITLIMKYIRSLKRINFWYFLVLIPFFMGLAYLIIFTNNQFSILNKFSNTSGLSRLEAIITSLELIKQHTFFGVGFHISPNNIPIGINYLGTIAQLGVIGTSIFLSPFLYVFIKIRKKEYHFLNIFIAITLTMILAQPIYDKAIVYLFLSMLLIISKNEISKDQMFHSKYVLKTSA